VSVRRIAVAAAAAAALHSTPLFAQPTLPGRVEISGGVQWIGRISFDPVQVNEMTFGGGTRTLFNTSSQLDPSIGAAVTVGVRVHSALALEANFAYGATRLTTHVTGDTEGAADVSVDSAVRQYLLGGDLLAQPVRWRRRRPAPFLVAGAAQLRQLNEGRTLVQTGVVFSAGGGVYYGRDLRGKGIRSTGIRLEARALAMRDGVVLDGRTHVTPALAASVFARF
jgi:hypothetical protein